MINFLWCILAYLYPVEGHKSKQNTFGMNKFNLDGLEFPIKVQDLPKFEK